MTETRSGESISLTNTGVLAGVTVGGNRNSAQVGDVHVGQQVTLADDLHRLVRQLEREGTLTVEQLHDVHDVAAAAGHADEGEPGAARRALAGVGGWVLDVARRIGADLAVQELEHFV